MAPSRVLDIRDGTGEVTGPVGPNQRIYLLVAGTGVVPVDAPMIVLNVVVSMSNHRGGCELIADVLGDVTG